MVKIFFLMLFFGVWSWTQAVGPAAVSQTLVPNFKAPAMPLPKGAPIAPLCDPSLNVSCLQQWIHQARPMAVTAPGAGLPTMKHFLPSLLIRNSLPADTKIGDDWELFTPSFYGARRPSSRNRTRYYRKKSDPSQVIRVTAGKDGREREVVSAKAVFVDGDSVEIVEQRADKLELQSKGKKSTEETETGVAGEVPAVNGSQPKDGGREDSKDFESGSVQPDGIAESAAAVPIEETDSVAGTGGAETSATGKAATGATRAAGAAFSQGTAVTDGGASSVASEGGTSDSPTLTRSMPVSAGEALPIAQTTRDSVAVPAEVGSEEDQPSGCVELEKDRDTELEAQAICEHCHPANPHLRRGIGMLKKENVWVQLVRALKAVTSGESGSRQRIQSKLRGTKICSPDEALNGIIKNFNNTCSPHSFDDFFKKIYCKSCKEQGVPAEIMLSMMTIESAGNCKAKGDSDGSIGLFQINSKAHQCENYGKGSSDNKTCFLDPDKNLTYGIDILKEKYEAVNPESAWRESCSKWSELDSDEKKKCKKEKKTIEDCGREKRDKWRKAVAAYNGGEGWIDRGVQSMEGHAVEVDVSEISDSNGNIIETARYEAIKKAEVKIREANQNIKRASPSGEPKFRADKIAAEAELAALRTAQPVTDIDAAGAVQKVTFYKSRDFSKGTSDLSWGHKGRFAGRAGKSKASWEELRIYLFMERFMPQNTGKTGRKNKNTLSNLAHVEAVLGRENKEGRISTGIIDYWTEYVKRNKPSACNR